MKQLAPTLLLLICQAPAAAEDWPTFMHDNARSGVTTDQLALPLSRAWDFTTPLPPQPAWPDAARADLYSKVFDLKTRQTFDRCYHVAAVGDAVYFGSSSTDQVYCLAAADGRQRWSFFAEGPVRLAPAVDDGRVYFGSDDGHVYCAAAADGEELWRHRPGTTDRRVAGNERVISVWPVRGGLAVGDGKIYGAAGMFPGNEVFVFGLDARSGEPIWKTGMSDLPVQGYLLASASKVYAPSGRNNPVVFERESGRRLHTVEGQGGTYALLAGDQLIFGPGKAGQLGVVESGAKDQLATFQGNHMLVTPGMSYLHTDEALSALDRSTYLELVRARRGMSARQKQLTETYKKLANKTSPQAAQLRDELGRLAKQLEANTQAMRDCVRWAVRCDLPQVLILAGDTLFAGGDGAVAAYRAADGREVWRAQVEGTVYGLAAANGALYVSTDAGHVICFRGN